MTSLNRLLKWPRFAEIYQDFYETFVDYPSRVKNKSALISFEKKNSIQEWEWKTIEALLSCGEDIPAPHCAEALDVYLLVFTQHVDYAQLVRMKNGDTPLQYTHAWTETAQYCLSAADIQTRNREHDQATNANKKKIRSWLKRWNAKQTTWSSRSRSSICKILRAQMGVPPKPTSPIQPLDAWFKGMNTLDADSEACKTLKQIEYAILRNIHTY